VLKKKSESLVLQLRNETKVQGVFFPPWPISACATL